MHPTKKVQIQNQINKNQTDEKHKTNLTNVNRPQAMQFAVSSSYLVTVH
jgi:hypothetical protein